MAMHALDTSSVLAALAPRDDVRIDCPGCGATIAASKASLFDATKELTPPAVTTLEELRRRLADDEAALQARIARVRRRSKTAARSVNVGKVVERIAPSLPGFPVKVDECRTLFEPIDYLVFAGMSRAAIESVTFVDLKSGRARLSSRQREIRQVVEAGHVTLHVAGDAEKIR